MKKFFLLCLGVIISLATYAVDAKKVAILEVVDKEGKLSYSQKLVLRSNLTSAVANTDGYEAYDRTDMDAIFSEHDFQRTGNVSESQIKQLGQMTGATFILVAEGVLVDEKKIFLTAKILNVETAKVETTDNVLMDNTTASMQRGCRQLASKMFGALAGVASSTNKFFSFFTKISQKSKQDSMVDAQKAERAAKEAEIKEQQRIANEKARQERSEAEAKARQERADAEAKAREEKRLAEERAAAELAERQKFYITRYDVSHWEYMGSLMDRKAYEAFMQSSCDKAALKYKKGKILIGTGWGIFGGGAALLAGGTTMLLLQDDFRLFYSGLALMYSGVGLVAVSIPIWATGYSVRNNAYKVYNEQCASAKNPISLKMNIGAGSLGLALNF